MKRDSPIQGRFYEIDGHRLPSVTHILQAISKPALINWAANQERALVTEAAADLYLDLVKVQQSVRGSLAAGMPRAAYVTTLEARVGKLKAHQRELAKASEIGTQVHKIVEWNLRRQLGQVVGPEPKITDAAEWAFMAFQDWAQSVALKPFWIEQTVFSIEHQYAGTMDLLAEVNGILTLIDLKSSKAIYGEAFLQNVAYQHALTEMGHFHAQRGLIVRLPKLQTDPAFEVIAVPPVKELFPTFLAVKAVWQWWYAQDEAWRAKREAEKVSV